MGDTDNFYEAEIEWWISGLEQDYEELQCDIEDALAESDFSTVVMCAEQQLSILSKLGLVRSIKEAVQAHRDAQILEEKKEL